MFNFNIDINKLPLKILYILVFIILGIVLYLMFRPDLIKFIFGKYNTENKEEVETVQLKGQLLIKGQPQVGIQIKIFEYSYSDSKTFSEGKFEFKGVPYNDINKIIHLQMKCDGVYKEIKGLDLTNKDKFPVKNSWIDLGNIDIEESPCANKIIPPSKLLPKRVGEVQVNGEITDENGKSVPFAKVILPFEKLELISDSNGLFNFIKKKKGDIEVRVEKIGFENYRNSYSYDKIEIKIQLERK